MRHAVYAGSFDPPTYGHLWVATQGAKLFDHVTVVVGINPTKSYLFEDWERVNMMRNLVRYLPNVMVKSTAGHIGHMAKDVGATYFLRGVRGSVDISDEYVLAALNKDYFPEMETVLLVAPSETSYISSSAAKIRAIGGSSLEGMLDPDIAEMTRLRVKEKRAPKAS